MAYILTSELTSYATLKSNRIYLNSVPVVSSRMTITTTSDHSNFIYGLSNDGENFEEVSSGVTHVFADSTGEQVKYQIWGKVPGTKITAVRVRVNP